MFLIQGYNEAIDSEDSILWNLRHCGTWHILIYVLHKNGFLHFLNNKFTYWKSQKLLRSWKGTPLKANLRHWQSLCPPKIRLCCSPCGLGKVQKLEWSVSMDQSPWIQGILDKFQMCHCRQWKLPSPNAILWPEEEKCFTSQLRCVHLVIFFFFLPHHRACHLSDEAGAALLLGLWRIGISLPVTWISYSAVQSGKKLVDGLSILV